MDDLISRQAAIDVVCGLDRSFVQYIEDIPSAQPEVVRCKECKHWEYDVIFADGWCRGKQQGNPEWFCADAERRTDDSNVQDK